MKSHATGEKSPALIEETIGANFERTVASYGDNEAVVEFASGRRWTYSELDRDVNALARGLIGAGIGWSLWATRDGTEKAVNTA